MIEFEKIKCIIWDLDETFWQGVLSEGNVSLIDKNLEFLNATLDMGIVHSICSKNDFSKTRDKLEELGIWDLFVFPSIDWSSKGTRIKNIISSMKLRDVNILFVDDNIQNLEEAKHFCKGIQVALPADLETLYSIVTNKEKKDIDRTRLKQYKILEEKEHLQTEFESNEEFLKSCDIKVTVEYDCLSYVDRIYDLLQRSNQLNYTKFRQKKAELIKLLEDKSFNCGYVNVKDRFGDYGLVGFFAIKDNKAIHYAFSCRTLGMQVEQYVYTKIGNPKIEVVGEVITKLQADYLPVWINQKGEITKSVVRKELSKDVLIKGPCDMMQMFSFIENNDFLHTEFTYTNNKGVLIEGHNHTAQIVTALYTDDARKQELLYELDWFDNDILNTKLQTKTFKIFMLSMLTDVNLGVYERKETGERIAFCEKQYDITDRKNWEDYLKGKIFNSNIPIDKSFLESFAEKYKYVPYNSENTICNLQKIYDYLEGTQLVLILGSEQEYKGISSNQCRNRHLEHKELNSKIKNWAKDKENITLIYLDNYLKKPSDFLDTINHFTKKVYYELANDIVDIVNDGNIVSKGKIFLIKEQILYKLKKIKMILRRIKCSEN